MFVGVELSEEPQWQQHSSNDPDPYPRSGDDTLSSRYLQQTKSTA